MAVRMVSLCSAKCERRDETKQMEGKTLCIGKCRWSLCYCHVGAGHKGRVQGMMESRERGRRQNDRGMKTGKMDDMSTRKLPRHHDTGKELLMTSRERWPSAEKRL